MKISISGNSVCLCLSDDEIHHLLSTGEVLNSCHFGDQSFVYGIFVDNGDEFKANFNQHRLKIVIPKLQIQEWVSRGDNSFSGETEHGTEVIVEKNCS